MGKVGHPNDCAPFRTSTRFSEAEPNRVRTSKRSSSRFRKIRFSTQTGVPQLCYIGNLHFKTNLTYLKAILSWCYFSFSQVLFWNILWPNSKTKCIPSPSTALNGQYSTLPVFNDIYLPRQWIFCSWFWSKEHLGKLSGSKSTVCCSKLRHRILLLYTS